MAARPWRVRSPSVLTEEKAEPEPLVSQEAPRAEVVLGQWTRVLFGALLQAGVRDAIISPGSRNTPLILAALAQSELRCHSVLDERSAGFFALGMAMSTGAPPLLICTSGSAAGHYLPAVMEAATAGHPLLVLTADRPAELQGCGAPQTVTQEGMFGSFVRSCYALGSPNASLDQLVALQRKIAQAAHWTHSPRRGPVHINFPVAKPLFGQEASTAVELQLRADVSSLLSSGGPHIPRTPALPSSGACADFLKSFVDGAKKCLITMGPVSRHEALWVRKIANSLQIPCLSELPQAGPAALLEFLAVSFSAKRSVAPDHILHVGLPCVSSAWAQYLKTSDAELWSMPGEQYRDPSQRAKEVLLGGLPDLLPLLAGEATSIAGKTDPYRAKLEVECDSLQQKFRELLSRLSSPGESETALPELLAHVRVLDSLGPRTKLLVANSLTLRLANWSAPLSPLAEVELHTGRGHNGIDGWFARAAGLASSGEEPTVLLVGDVSAAHDLSSLALVRRYRQPLVLVVFDNGGGKIFDHLPLRSEVDLNSDAWRFWTTPPEINWEAAALAYGIGYRSCRSERSITNAMNAALTTNAATLIVISTDSESTHPFLARMRQLVSGPR